MALKRVRSSVGPLTVARRRLSNALRPVVRVTKAPADIHVDWDIPVKVRDGTACGSFCDHSLHSRGAFEVYRRAGSPRKWLYTHRDGKWCAYYSKEATDARGRFFDYTLKGLENGWDSQPAVRLAIHEAGPEPASVMNEDSWPPKDLKWQKLWLDSRTGTMTQAGAPMQAASRSFSTR